MHSKLVIFPKTFAVLMRMRSKTNYEKMLYLQKICRKETIFDLGANIGYYTTLFSQLTGKGGKVHAFEPLQENFRKLQSNTSRSCTNVVLNQTGIDIAKSTKTIFFDTNDLEKASIKQQRCANVHSREIDVTTLDNYISDNRIPQVDFIKCDIEGHEMHALMGMPNTLRKFHPKLSIEVTLPHDERKELTDFLQSFGYNNFQLIEKGYPRLNLAQLEKEEYFYLYASRTKNS